MIITKKFLRILKYLALIVLWITWLASFSNAVDYTLWNYTNWDYASARARWQVWTLITSPLSSNYQISVLSKWNVSSKYWDNVKSILYTNPNFIFFRDSNNNPYFYAHASLWAMWSKTVQWSPTSYFICSWLVNNQVPSNCTRYNIDWLDSYNYFRYINSSDLYFVSREVHTSCWWYYQDMQITYTLCFWNSVKNNSLCYTVWFQNMWVVVGCSAWLLGNEDTTLVWSIWLSSPTFWDLWWTNSPWDPWSFPVSWTWDWVYDYDYVPVSESDYINYWEKTMNFNEDICYVWTRNLSWLWEDRLTYYQWTWYTLFDTFSKLYNKTTFKITDLWTFLDSRLINYDSWWLWYNRDMDWEVKYNVNYNYWQSVSLDYWPWLTNPFLNNLAVYTFIPSTIREFNVEWTVWEEVATYCYYKLKRDRTVSNDWSNYSIEDNHNSAYDQNVWVYTSNSRRQWQYFSWASEIIWQSWHWTPLDYFDWEDNLDFWTFFSNAFNKFKINYWDLSQSDLWLGFLPSYIVLFLLAIIFFRFLSH